MPALQNVYQKYMDKPVVILAANMTHQDDLSRVLSFATERNLSLPILLDPSGELSNKYALRALPTTFFIDHQGTIRKVVAGGPIPEALLSSQIDRLLEERR
jgi:peroxiredoxin